MQAVGKEEERPKATQKGKQAKNQGGLKRAVDYAATERIRGSRHNSVSPLEEAIDRHRQFMLQAAD